ncbi:MAG: hypothetical protein QXQ14_02115 [Candidatus Aenigmatarchaeota archaeon]
MAITKELEKLYEKELEKAKKALLKAKNTREIRALQARIEFLKKILNK